MINVVLTKEDTQDLLNMLEYLIFDEGSRKALRLYSDIKSQSGV